MANNRTEAYHSASTANLLRVGVSELIGTFFYVGTGLFLTVAAKLGFEGSGGSPDFLAVALATGLALMLMAAALGHVSGAHLNPAVTIAQVIAHNLHKRYMILYFISQLAGGVLAALAVWAFARSGAFDQALLGAPSVVAGVPLYKAFGIELVAGFLIGLVTISLTKDGRGPVGMAVIPVGFATTVSVLLSGPMSSGSFNPAKALGPMLVTMQFDEWWLFVIAPIIGAAAAAFVYHRFLLMGQPVQLE